MVAAIKTAAMLSPYLDADGKPTRASLQSGGDRAYNDARHWTNVVTVPRIQPTKERRWRTCPWLAPLSFPLNLLDPQNPQRRF